MNIELRQPYSFIIALAVMIIMISARWAAGGFDFSYFFTAGSDFTDASNTMTPVKVMEGQGYDGQFFYRMALNPFDFAKTNYGVTYDYPVYRLQRIGYPLLVWLFSFGGIPSLVPLVMVLVNLFSFAGVLIFTSRISSHFKADRWFQIAPLFLCGIYMSVAKDLSEVTELFFVLGSFYYLLRSQHIWFMLFASFAVLTRETAVVALFPLAVFYRVRCDKANRLRSLSIFIPFFVVALWKFYLLYYFRNDTPPPASGNFGLPFTGMINGMRINTNISSSFHLMQSVFWWLYFIWQIVFVSLVLKVIFSKRISLKTEEAGPATAFITWFIFSIFFSAAIYGDDWSFVRVLTLMNMLGLLVMMVYRSPINRYMILFSVPLVLLTIVRMIIRQ